MVSRDAIAVAGIGPGSGSDAMLTTERQSSARSLWVLLPGFAGRSPDFAAGKNFSNDQYAAATGQGRSCHDTSRVTQ